MTQNNALELYLFRLFQKPRSASLQKIISRYARENKKVYFIQIGSNDGVTRDPLNRHIIEHKWNGVVIEPVRYIYNKLVATYKDHLNIKCENVAIADEEGTRNFYRLKENSDGLPEWYDQLGSFNQDIVLAHRNKIKDFDTYFITDVVECITLDTLLEKHDVQKIDLLHIDTEGYDYEILKMVNFNKYQPDIILFEHKHLPLNSYKEAIRYLKNHNYRLYSEKNDTLAKFVG